MAKITATCEKCGAKYHVADSLTGKRARCKKCRAVFLISSPAEAVVSAAPAVTQEANAGVHPESWQIGDVILDTYEVLPVMEDGIQKPFHQAGGMGRVYKVRNRDWDMDMAVKVPKAEKFQNASQKANFVRECHTWMDLGLHPHIVTCGFVRVLGDVPCVFAEYIDGGSLKSWIYNRKLYEGGHEEVLKRILDIAIQFARGLDYAHEKGMIHQDVKPDNLLLEEGDQGKLTAKVADFGMINARAATGETISSDPQRSIVAAYGGGMTEAYCSPEQADILAKSKAGVPKEQLPKLTRRTDIWSWAVSVFEMFTGEVTWRGGQVAGASLETYLDMGIDDDAIPPMPEALVELLKHCFQRNPDDRPRSMAEVSKVLETIYQSVVGGGYPHDAPTAPTELSDILNNKALSFLELSQMDGISSTEQETMTTNAGNLWKDALKLDPHHLESTYNRGLRSWRTAQIDDLQLVQQLEEVRTSHDDSWRDEYLLGLVHLERGSGESAVKVLLEEAEQRPNNSAKIAAALKEAREQGSSCVQTLKRHSRPVNSVCLGRNGRLALSGSYDGTLRLWDASTGQCVRTFMGHEAGISSVCLSADGRLAFSRAGIREEGLREEDSTAKLWDTSTGQCLRTIRIGRGVSASMSADARSALMICNKSVELWDILKGQRLKSFRPPSFAHYVGGIYLSAEGRLALAGGSGGWLRLWDTSSGNCLRVFEGLTDWVWSVCLSVDGRRVLSGSGDGTVHLWDVATGKCLRAMKGHEQQVVSVCLDPSGRRALSGSWDGALRLWDVATGQCLRTFEGHTHRVLSVALSSDGRWALSGSWDNTLKLWSLSVSPGTASASVAQAVSARVRLQQEDRFSQLVSSAQEALASGDVGRAIPLAAEAQAVPGRARDRRLLNLRSKLKLHTQTSALRGGWHQRTLGGHAKSYAPVCLSADGRWALSAGGQTSDCVCILPSLWDLSSGVRVKPFGEEGPRVHALCLNAEGNLALLACGDKRLHLWNISDGQHIGSFEGHTKMVTDVCVSADWRLALSASEDHTIRLWDIASKQCLRELEAKGTRSFGPICLSSDGRYALSSRGLDNVIHLWDMVGGGLAQTFEGHEDSVESVCLSADRRLALSGSSDKTLRLWDVCTGECLRVFSGHEWRVDSVCLSVDGRFALSGCWDRTIRIWDVHTGQCLRSFQGHSDVVTSVSLSADGRYVISASNDKTLRLWELDWEFEAMESADWDDGALPHAQNFLTLHCSCGDDGISRVGKPEWNDDDFKQLLHTLGCAGYGWLRPEGIRKKLEEMTANWQGPPPLPWESADDFRTTETPQPERGEAVQISIQGSVEQTDPVDVVKGILDGARNELEAPDAPKVDGYEIEKVLRTDGFARVYAARDCANGRSVAIKTVSASMEKHLPSQERCEQKYDLAMALKHTNIVEFLSSGVAGDISYSIWELCAGGGVDELIARRGGKLALAEAGHIILDALDGMVYMHREGVVHRDLKPANILLAGSEDEWVAKIAGLASAKRWRTTRLSHDAMDEGSSGAPAFIARETLLEPWCIKPVSDIWSMGAILYNMLTGSIPRDFERGKNYMETVLHGPIVPVRERDPQIPPPVAEVIDRALANQVKDRYQDAAEMKDAWEKVL
jgi:WD40 repeat protein/serine/threonine protein kinase